MNSNLLSRIPAAALLSALLLSGPVACSPSVTEIELSAARDKQEAARKKLSTLDGEIAKLHDEEKALKIYEGPEHQATLKKVSALQSEKAELETIKADVDARVEQFVKGTKTHREALGK